MSSEPPDQRKQGKKQHPASLANLKPWKPGQSGNPLGNNGSQRLRQRIQKDIDEVIDVVVSAAKGGDIAAARLLLERALPPMKAQEEPVSVELPEGGSLADKAAAVVSAAGRGQIAPGQAAQLVGAIGAVAGIMATTELTDRLERLEQLQLDFSQGAESAH